MRPRSIELESARLRLRAARPEDVEPLRPVFSDPQVMRYVGDGSPRDEKKVRDAIERWMRLEPQGMGLFTISVKDDDAVIGDCGLIPIKRTGETERGPEIELGYRLGRAHWGRGYASEAAGRVMQYAFDTLALPRVIAVTHLENAASRRVLEKTGFRYEGTTDAYYDDTLHLYAMEAR